MAMAALISANIAAQAAAQESEYSNNYSDDLSYTADVYARDGSNDYYSNQPVLETTVMHPTLSNEELGIQDVTRTTMGHKIVPGAKSVPSKNWWQKFINGLTIRGTGRHKGKARW